MIYAITYTDNVQSLTARGLELCNQGKWSKYMHTVNLDADVPKIKAIYGGKI